MKVDRTATPLTELEVASVLQRAWIALFGQAPSAQVLGVGWAQIALENAHGQKIWNNNFGNITTGGGAGDFYELETKEQIHPGEWKDVVMKYAAHPTPEDGAEAYWRLVTGPHYAPAFAFFEMGEASAAAVELHRLGYFTANVGDANTPGTIAHSFGVLYRHFQSTIAERVGLDAPPPVEPPLTSSEQGPAAGSGGLSICGTTGDVGDLETEPASSLRTDTRRMKAMAKDEKTTRPAAATAGDLGELQRENGHPIAMCPDTDRLRPLGQGGVCFEAFWNRSKEKDPSITAQEAYDQWHKI